MVSLLKEQENFLRNAILTVDHSKEVLQCFLEQHLENNHQTFEDFLNQNQHDIYHLYYDAKCCQCGLGPLQRKKRILFASQMELLFDKNSQSSFHKTTRHSDFCCCYAKKNVTTAVLDLTLARCLLMNCCIDMFWYSCLDFKGVTLEQFLNSNRHIMYHLWKSNNKCCKCQPDFISPCNAPLIMENEWKKMFSATLPPCENDRKRPASGAISICAFAATPSITVQQIHIELQNIIIQYCCSTRKSVEKLAELRNSTFGHVKKTSMSCAEFSTFMAEAEDAILDLATVCGKEDYYRQRLLDLRDKPLDARMFRQYERVLLQTISNYEDIIKENEVLNDGIESLQNSNTEMKEKIEKLCILQIEGPERKRIIDETSAEIEIHEKDVAYVEIEAVRHCIKLLESKNIVLLSGREGSGKSKTGLEILRQLKKKNRNVDVFKLVGLHYVNGIVKCNVTSIVLFDDAFDKTCDKHILDQLYSYITLNKVKVIFILKNTIRHACKMLLSSHTLFHDLVDIDLNSEKFKLTMEEKDIMLFKYCDINNIMISDGKEDNTDQSVSDETERDDNEANNSVLDQTAVILKREIMYEIITTDPFLGFPECCRLFTEKRTNTTLGSSFFKWPSTMLVNDIEELRMEGMDNYMNGLKYVILIHILTLGSSHEKCQEYYLKTKYSLVKRNIDAQDCKHIFYVCYNKNVEVRTSDIEHVCKALTGRYLAYRDGAYYFQHQAIMDSVLISYSKINSKDIIPLLRFDHMVDLVRPQNYIEQEDEIVIKMSKQYNYELAAKIISLMNSRNFHLSNNDRIMESKIITENDVDFINQLIVCIHNISDNSQLQLSLNICHYFLLCLLRNIGKLENNMLTVNHIKDQLLISVTIGDKNISPCVDSNSSLICAFRSKHKDIVEWLLKNTDHSLLDFDTIVIEIRADIVLEYLQLLLENVKNDMIDMTQLFINVCLICCNEYEHAIDMIDWMVDYVDKSLIDYNKCIEEMLGLDELELFIDLILYIVKKTNHRFLDTNNIVYQSCLYGSTDVIVKVLQNVDPEFFDKEELINTMILYNENEHDWKDIVELILPWIKYCDINSLIEMADFQRWYGVLELLIKHVSDLSIDIVQLIEKIFKLWDDDEEETGEYDYEHMENVFRSLLKYHMDTFNVAKIIMEKACDVGSHTVVEELLLDKFSNISYYLNITLHKCLSRRLDEISISNDGGYRKLLLLFIQRVNNQFIDLNGLMNDLCRIGHSSAVLWLLENKHSYRFDMRNIMNKACYHGDLKLVDYLFQKYSAADFDYKTAMIKACRHAQCKTLDVCKWLWENIDRSVFDMKAALNNASRYDNTETVVWILTEVDTGLYDTKAAMLCACEHGKDDTVQLLLDTSGIKMLDFQYALTLASRNKNNGLHITQMLYGRANKSNLDINGVLSDACKYYRSDIIQWIIETCDQNITVTETSDGHKKFIKCLDKNVVDMGQLITCILDMNDHKQKMEDVDETKNELILLILKQSDPWTIDIHKLLTESCKKDWIEIFKWILLDVSLVFRYIREATNIACRNGALSIVKWSLENIDANSIDLDNIMIESCGYGWLECLVLMKKHFNRYAFDMQAAMFEACTYNRLHIAKWLLQNVSYQRFDLRLLLQEAGRNGWINIFIALLKYFHFHKSDMHIAIGQALENGQLMIADLAISKVGKEGFDISSISEKAYTGANKEGVVNFLLLNFDPRSIDIATIMANACLYGWKDIATFIVDNDLSCLCDLSLAFNTACDNGELEIAQLLLEKVDSHILTTVDKAMHSVAVKGWDEIALLLLEKVKHTRLDIGNALIEACRHGEIDVAQAILRKVEKNMLDVKTALNKACENHMHEELVLWILKNIDQEQVDLKTVKIQAIRHKWRKVQFAIPEVDNEDLSQVEHETGTDCIVIL